MSKKPLMGLCPIGKFVFSNEDAIKYKKLLQQKLRQWDVRFIDMDTVLPDGMVRDQKHVKPAVKHFTNASIDCLFLPHCNFGTEGAASMIAHKLNVPTLLWGPRDDAPLEDGSRLRDSLCGMFATSKVLGKLGVKFTYIENCSVEDDKLKQGVDTFLRAANIADVFRRGTKIGLIGGRIDFFWTTIINESELLEKFNVEVLPIDMVEFIDRALDSVKTHPNVYRDEVKLLREKWTIEHFDDDQPLMNVLAVRDTMLAVAKENELEGLAVQDFMSLVDKIGAYGFLASSFVANSYAMGYESDIHGCLSDILIRRADFNTQAGFLADITIRHPQNDNAVLLWHSGAALSMMDPQVKPSLGRHWILPSELSGMTHFKLKEGPITITRFDGDHGQYKLAVGEGKSIPGPYTLNNYVWMQVRNWPEWERKLMEGPFIHHVAMTYGHFAAAMKEAVKYIPNLELLELD